MNGSHGKQSNNGEDVAVAKEAESAAAQAAQAEHSEAEAGQAEQGPEAELSVASPDELRRLLETAEGKAEEHWNALLRAQAEVENVRKRAERDVENAHKYALDRFVAELLPVKDSMELGLAAAAAEDAGVDKLREGSELTLKMFASALEKFGVTEVDPQGEAFNPEFHQAMSMQEAKELKSGTVVTVYQKGYVLNGRLVRPALVIVAK